MFLGSANLVIGPRDCEIALTIVERADSLFAEFNFSGNGIGVEEGNWLAECYPRVLEQMMAASSPSQMLLPAAPWFVGRDAEKPDLAIRVAATFTSEPIEASLRFWIDSMGLTSHVEFGPFGQVFQSLLDPSSHRPGIRDVLVLLIRLEDWQGTQRDSERRGWPESPDALHRNVDELVDLLGRSALSGRSHVVCFGTPSRSSESDPELCAFEAETVSRLAKIPGVKALSGTEIASRYGVAAEMARPLEGNPIIPYSTEFFAALGTAVARAIHGMLAPPRKVIAVDCDDTLWCGRCAEDGPEGVHLGVPERTLQEFLVARQKDGFLICLVSKNHQDDVLRTLESRTDMPLRPEHVLTSRINWKTKVENLIDLSRNLGLGLDSFVFFDNDQLECSLVRNFLPGVLTVHFSQEWRSGAEMLSHLWCFDLHTAPVTTVERTEFLPPRIPAERSGEWSGNPCRIHRGSRTAGQHRACCDGRYSPPGGTDQASEPVQRFSPALL